MHDTFAMAETERFEELPDVKSYIIAIKSRIQAAKIGVLHMFKDQGW